jgi:hypothetical protein
MAAQKPQRRPQQKQPLIRRCHSDCRAIRLEHHLPVVLHIDDQPDLHAGFVQALSSLPLFAVRSYAYSRSPSVRCTSTEARAITRRGPFTHGHIAVRVAESDHRTPADHAIDNERFRGAVEQTVDLRKPGQRNAPFIDGQGMQCIVRIMKAASKAVGRTLSERQSNRVKRLLQPLRALFRQTAL